MRKMVPTGRGDRVQFSIPDHEWALWVMICRGQNLDPVEALQVELKSGFAHTPGDLRKIVRLSIERFVYLGINRSDLL